MNKELSRALWRGDGVVTRAEALKVITPRALEHAAAKRAVVRAFPGVYLDPQHVEGFRVRCRAALAYAGVGAAISHVTALALWRLGPDPPDIHVVVPKDRRLRSRPGLVFHRARSFWSARAGGLAVTDLGRSIVDSWPLLTGDAQRSPAIDAVNGRMITPQALLDEAIGAVWLPQRADLLKLCHRLVVGCRSWLELYG